MISDRQSISLLLKLNDYLRRFAFKSQYETQQQR